MNLRITGEELFGILGGEYLHALVQLLMGEVYVVEFHDLVLFLVLAVLIRVVLFNRVGRGLFVCIFF